MEDTAPRVSCERRRSVGRASHASLPGEPPKTRPPCWVLVPALLVALAAVGTLASGEGLRAQWARLTADHNLELRRLSLEAFEGTNAFRASQGLGPLRWSEGTAAVAAAHAAEMAANERLTHRGLPARATQLPVLLARAGENLARCPGPGPAACALAGWAASPSHRENLSGDWALCGVGAARAPGGVVYLAQLFARTVSGGLA